MDKHSKDKLTRMIQAQSDVERSHNSLRPLKDVTVVLACGCEICYASDEITASTRGSTVYCFRHMRDVKVSDVWIL